MYGTGSGTVLSMLSDAKVRQVIQEANKIRNDFHGHAGAIGDATAEKIHQELLSLVQRIRGVFGRHWQDYELIQPVPGRISMREDSIFVTARRIMGNKTPFEEREFESSIGLEDNALYLFDHARQTALRLKEFIEVMPSKEKQTVACFIFSRIEKDGARLVSYHFDQESEILHDATAIADTLTQIQASASGEE
jgi:hypothetical protein